MSGSLINNKILHFSTRIMQKKSYKGDDNEIIELSRIKKIDFVIRVKTEHDHKTDT